VLTWDGFPKNKRLESGFKPPILRSSAAIRSARPVFAFINRNKRAVGC